MNNHTGLTEDINLKKITRRKDEVYIQSYLHVEKYHKGENEPFEITPEIPNTIVAGGFQRFINLVDGTSAAHYFNASILTLTPGKDIVTSGPPSFVAPSHAAPSRAIQWEFIDNTSDIYTPLTAKLYDSLGGQQFNSIDTSGLGTKPASQNWRYYLKFEAYSLTSAFQSAGLWSWLQDFGGLLDEAWEGTNPRLQPYSDLACTVPVGAAIAPSLYLWEIVSGNYRFHWEFNSPAGQNTGEWRATKVYHNGSATVIRQYGCRADNSTCGVKDAGDDWTYQYLVTLMQGTP